MDFQRGLLRSGAAARELSEKTMTQAIDFTEDLKLDDLVTFMVGDDSFNRKMMTNLLLEMNTDPEVVLYRADILDDFLNIPLLLNRFTADLVDAAKNLRRRDPQKPVFDKEDDYSTRVANSIRRFLECLAYLTRVGETLRQFQGKYQSAGLTSLAEDIDRYLHSEEYHQIDDYMQTLLSCVSPLKSLTISVEFNDQFLLNKAILLEIVSGTIEQQSRRRTAREKRYEVPLNTGQMLDNGMDLKRKILGGLMKAITEFSDTVIIFLQRLHREMVYYNGVAKLVKTLTDSGLSVCRPEIAPLEERTFEVTDMYDLAFALFLIRNNTRNPQGEIVANNVRMDDAGRILLITGPNQGGKTTFTRGLGAVQVLAQAGIPIPGTKARISPVDMVFTHFPDIEKPDTNEGRLGQELARVSIIMRRVTEHSMVLMNESFATTNAKEGGAIAKGILKGLSLVGIRGLFVTHLIDLAEQVDILNQETKGQSQLASWVAGLSEEDSAPLSDAQIIRRSYRITPGKPAKLVYASDIARQYGISYEQVVLSTPKIR